MSIFFINILSPYFKSSKVQLGLVFIVSLIVFSVLQAAPVLSDPDSFYHARLTTHLRDFNILREFPWTQSSLYKLIFIDHHFGYHLLLIPFVSVGPPLLGIKAATVFFAALTLLAAAWCLLKWRVPWWGTGVLLLLTASPFLFRLSLAKAPAIGIGIAIVGYYLVTTRKLSWLFWFAWFYAWLYSAWPLLLVMAIVYIAVESLDLTRSVSRKTETEILNSKILKISHWLGGFLKAFFTPPNRRLFGVIILGYLAGLIINPYFPTNLLYLKQLFAMALTAYHKFLGIGAEWYPYNPFELVANTALPFGVWLLLTIAAFFNLKRQTILTKSTWWLALIFLFYTFKARRQVEYLVPWLILSSGLMMRDLWPLLSRPGIRAELLSWLPPALRGKLFKLFIIIYLAIVIPLGLGQGVKTAYNSLRSGYKLERLAGASGWLKNNTAPRSIVFQSDWSSFPILWYNNQHNYYLTGLDQTFMYEYNQSNYWLWVAASKGERRGLYKIARDNFGAAYILLDKDYPAMLLWLNRDKRFRKVYEDKEAMIFAL